MIKKRTFSTYYELVIGLFACLMILAPKLIGFGFIGFAIIIVLGLLGRKLQFKINSISILFCLLYSTYLVYVIWTRNQDQANKYIENKLSFVLIPLFFSFPLKEKIKFQKAIYLLIIALLLLFLIDFSRSVFSYLDGNVNCFYSSAFSKIHHPSYASAFYMLGLGLLIYGYLQKIRFFKLIWIIPIGLIFLLATFLCLSLAGMLFCLLAAGIFLLAIIYRKFGKITAMVAVIIVPVVGYFTIMSVPQIEGEYTSAKFYAKKYFKNKERFVKSCKYPLSGSETRLVMWTISVEVIKKYPFGVGTGNIDEVLSHRLRKLNQFEMAKMEYNPHNQFLQTAVEIGLIGLSILILIIFISVYKSIQYKNWILLLVVSNFAFNMLFESMLQQQSGIVFYTFILCLGATYYARKDTSFFENT